jgi:WS/DGAT/MGAT family acyltransferase
MRFQSAGCGNGKRSRRAHGAARPKTTREEGEVPLKRLSALDDAFLAVESPTAHMHVGWVALFDPPPGRPAPGFAEICEHIERRLGRARRFRQVLRRMPLGIGAAAWVDDAGFDVARHLSHAVAPRVDEVVDGFFSEPLPRDRPLWAVRVVDGLDGGRLAVVGKAHHCMVDGIAAVELASLLVDPEPEQPDPKPTSWRPARPPGRLELLGAVAADALRAPRELARAAAGVVGSPVRAAGQSVRAGRALVDAARPAPGSPLNQPISSLRHLEMVSRPFEHLYEIKRAFGVPLNDVVLAACTGAVRSYLRDRGAQPIRLKAMVPVNVRNEEAAGELGNALSFIFVDLPCEEPDPARRLMEIHLATRERKRAGEIEGGTDVLRSLAYTPSPLRHLASRLIASPRAFNLVVSNIPAPRIPLYMRGCRLSEAYPVVPIADRHGLSIGVTTLGRGAHFGLYADPVSLPDVGLLADELDRELERLADAAPRSASADTPVAWPTVLT